MNINEALYSYLSNYSGLTDLVGNRIYPVKMPKNVIYPAITLQIITGLREHLMGSDSNLIATSVRATSWARTFDSAKQVINQVKEALQDYSGTMADSVVVQRIFTESDQAELYDVKEDVYYISQDFLIWWEEQ